MRDRRFLFAVVRDMWDLPCRRAARGYVLVWRGELMDFTQRLLEVIGDFLTYELHYARETVDSHTGSVQSIDGTLRISLDDGRTFRLTITEETV